MTRETVFISRIDFLHASAMVDISCTACRDLSKLNQDHWISVSEPASTFHTNEARFSPLKIGINQIFGKASQSASLGLSGSEELRHHANVPLV